MSRIRGKLDRRGYGGAVNDLISQGYSEAEAEAGILSVIPRKVEDEIRDEIKAVNHHQCRPEDHDRSLPDGGGRLYGQPYDEYGYLSDKQVMAADGLLGCNDCGLALFYCTNDEWYHHVDPEAGCFLCPAWG